MRVEPFTVGNYVHVLKRGARSLDIVHDLDDRRRFLALLYYMNDEFIDKNWLITTKIDFKGSQTNLEFLRPESWPVQKPLVKILCYTLMPNHFHLVLREISEGGISKFMQKLCQSMTLHFNEKNDLKGKGSIFQGSYKAKVIEGDTYLRYLSSYVMVKNTFELYPQGGLSGAKKNFEDAWEWAKTYEFSSFPDYLNEYQSKIIDKDVLGEMFNLENFKSFSRDVILGGKWEKRGGDAEFARLATE